MTITINNETISDEDIERASHNFVDSPDPQGAAARTLAVYALLRQRRLELNIEAETEDAAIDVLIEREVRVPEPTDAECERFYAANPEKFRGGDLFEASHILFGVTEGAPLEAIRLKAEETLFELMKNPDRFEEIARAASNCPSGEVGGNLGQLDEGSCVPEFFRALREHEGTGMMPRLVRTRYGFHIVKIARRIEGRQLPFEMVKERIARLMRQAVRQKAFIQYVHLLAGQAQISGIDLEGAATPLVQ